MYTFCGLFLKNDSCATATAVVRGFYCFVNNIMLGTTSCWINVGLVPSSQTIFSLITVLVLVHSSIGRLFEFKENETVTILF